MYNNYVNEKIRILQGTRIYYLNSLGTLFAHKYLLQLIWKSLRSRCVWLMLWKSFTGIDVTGETYLNEIGRASCEEEIRRDVLHSFDIEIGNSIFRRVYCNSVKVEISPTGLEGTHFLCECRRYFHFLRAPGKYIIIYPKFADNFFQGESDITHVRKMELN